MAVHIRHARKEDIEEMAKINVEAFNSSPYHQALFPEHLSIKSNAEDHHDWGVARMSKGLLQPNTHWLAAVVKNGSTEEIAGFAEWVAPNADGPPPPVNKSTEEKTEPRQENPRKFPANMDKDAMERLDKEIEEVMGRATPLFGGKKLSDMWTLNVIAVSKAHRGKGVGKALTRWGMEAADADNKDIWFIAAPAGYPMYLSLGFKELTVGSRAGEAQYVMFREVAV